MASNELVWEPQSDIPSETDLTGMPCGDSEIDESILFTSRPAPFGGRSHPGAVKGGKRYLLATEGELGSTSALTNFGNNQKATNTLNNKDNDGKQKYGSSESSNEDTSKSKLQSRSFNAGSQPQDGEKLQFSLTNCSNIDYDHGHATGAIPCSSPSKHGHSFVKKTFHKPAYCHHCTEMVWGILGTGFICEVCNFLVHERCLQGVISACTTVASTLSVKPVSHCWSEPGHFKRKFCNVCRKRLDYSPAIRCEVCEYHCHVDCQDYVNNDCKEGATYTPDKNLATYRQYHHWREGNLPSNFKCTVCRKTCWSAECLAGYRCEWCGIVVHPGCFRQVPVNCDFGVLRDIILPPQAVCLPRTKIPMENIIGVTRKPQSRIISEDWSSSGESKEDSYPERKSPKESSEKEGNEEYVKAFDGNNSYKRKTYRSFNFSKSLTPTATVEQCLKTFHLSGHSDDYYVCEINDKDGSEHRLDECTSLKSQLKFDPKRPNIVLRQRDPKDPNRGKLKVYPGSLLNFAQITAKYKEIPITSETTAREVIILALRKFGCEDLDVNKFHLMETCLVRNVSERQMDPDERPWDIIHRLKKESVRGLRLTRFSLRATEDPHGPGVTLFVGNLKENLSQRFYEKLLLEKLGEENKWSNIEVIYYENGCLVMTYSSGQKAERAYDILKESTIMDKQLMVMLLPRILPHLIPDGIQPLLVFVNVKSGGCQGVELITAFRKLLNPHQVFNLDYGGPLPGLYCFRDVSSYKVLVCGGDGTVGWTLSCLDSVGQDAACNYPPMAVLPLGTGNDLARVLRWGSGYTGAEDPLTILRDVANAEEVKLDRWTLVIRSEESDKDETKMQLQLQTNVFNAEDNTFLIIMNNYFGIGIDADLSLDFHNARSENPTKFNSRIHNKSVYFKMGLRKMVNRTACKDLHKQIVVEADGKVVDLPPLEGIIVLNIMSWGGGANPWGVEDDHFSKPNHYDALLEVVGVSGVIHMGQIYSGLRTGIHLAQAGHLKITLKNDVPVQVDGEPFIQPPGQITVLRSALRATMLKKVKKVKRRNTDPNVTVPGTEATSSGSSNASKSGGGGGGGAGTTSASAVSSGGDAQGGGSLLQTQMSTPLPSSSAAPGSSEL